MHQKKLTLIMLLLLSLVIHACRQQPGPGEKNPTEALYVPDDLQATLWAESPLLRNPTNMDIDAKGRIWVTEAVNYRDFNNKPDKFLHYPKGDEVVILEDRNGDGVADTSKVFVQDTALRSPLGIAVLGNKVIVSCSPSIIVYTDEDGDDHPDKKEVFLTGFGGLDHDHGLHSVVAGPDGRWYFSVGDAGPHIVKDHDGWTLRSGSMYTGGTPYDTANEPGLKSDDGRVWVGGLALRIQPDGKKLAVVAHNFRNAYELALDSYGNMWQSDNDDQVQACRTTWLMEGANAGYFSDDGSRYWEADKRPGQSIFTAHWHQDDPGVIPAGDNTGAGAPTGMVVYEGDELGAKYRGLLLSADAGRNTIFGYFPQPEGAGYQLKRFDFASSVKGSTAGYKWDSLESDSRKWFRPSDVAVGPDGAIYVADWYDPIVGGHIMRDSIGYGRIYRIAPKNKTLKLPEIELNTPQGQVQALLSPAVNVRYLGFEKLLAQGDKALPELDGLLQDPNPYHKARAIWLMAQLGPDGETAAEQQLSDPDPLMRITAFRALRAAGKDVLPLARMLVSDTSAAVRREVAVALRDLPFAQCRDLLLQLAAGYDGHDRWYLEALGIGAEGKEAALYPLLTARFGADPLQWDARMAGLAWRLHPAVAATAFSERAQADKLPEQERIQALTALAFIPTRAAAEAMQHIVQETGDTTLLQQAIWWIDSRKNNDWTAFIHDKNGATDARLPVAVRGWRNQLLNGHLSWPEREKVALSLAKDSAGGMVLVQLAAAHQLPDSIQAAITDALLSNPDRSVRVLAGDYFKKSQETSAYSIPEIVAMKGDPQRGKQVFLSTCASCHHFGTDGGSVGPDLTKIAEKFDEKNLLDAIIHPNASIVFGYEPWLITTKNGATVYGLLQSDGKNVVLKDPSGKQIVIPATDIVSRKKTRTLMPDPETLQLSNEKLADLTAYLMTAGGK